LQTAGKKAADETKIRYKAAACKPPTCRQEGLEGNVCMKDTSWQAERRKSYSGLLKSSQRIARRGHAIVRLLRTVMNKFDNKR
jgi:hypothetical protein